jgi:hypothetical protein
MTAKGRAENCKLLRYMINLNIKDFTKFYRNKFHVYKRLKYRGEKYARY